MKKKKFQITNYDWLIILVRKKFEKKNRNDSISMNSVQEVLTWCVWWKIKKKVLNTRGQSSSFINSQNRIWSLFSFSFSLMFDNNLSLSLSLSFSPHLSNYLFLHGMMTNWVDDLLNRFLSVIIITIIRIIIFIFSNLDHSFIIYPCFRLHDSLLFQSVCSITFIKINSTSISTYIH